MASLTDFVTNWMTLAVVHKLAGLVGVSVMGIMCNALAGTFRASPKHALF
jgi:hypothetical protein